MKNETPRRSVDVTSAGSSLSTTGASRRERAQLAHVSMNIAWFFAATALGVLACNSQPTPLAGDAPAPPRVIQGNPAPSAVTPITPDAPAPEPDRLACVRDTDCVVAPYPSASNRCCLGFADAHSHAWDRWLHDWVELHCHEKQDRCAPGDFPSAPGSPPPCYFVPRCTAGGCEGSCGSGKPPGERERR